MKNVISAMVPFPARRNRRCINRSFFVKEAVKLYGHMLWPNNISSLLDSDKFNQVTSRRHRFGKQILRKNQAKNKQKKVFKQFRCSILTQFSRHFKEANVLLAILKPTKTKQRNGGRGSLSYTPVETFRFRAMFLFCLIPAMDNFSFTSSQTSLVSH